MATDRYRILRTLDTGGEGVVHLAEDHHRNGRSVAIKRLHPDLNVSTLSREFDTLRQFSHPHIATVFDYGTDQDSGFMVEAFVDGKPLDQALSTASFAAQAKCLIQLLRALEYVHSRGFVHGDIKPSNVLVERLDSGYHVRLIDFGLAGRIGDATGRLTGTPEYLAPERIRGEGLSATTDLYSFGVTAYEVLTGALPFHGKSINKILQAHLDQIPDNPSATNPALPPTIDDILCQLLEKKPGDRPPSARDTIAQLAAAAGLDLETETSETLRGYLQSGTLVGREAAIEAGRLVARTLLNDPTTPGHEVVWWHGADGSGRSRLLQELSGEAKISGLRVVHARGGMGQALGPVRQWLRGVGVELPPLEDAQDHLESIDQAVQAILEASRSQPTLCLLDDYHLADGMTRDVVRILLDHLNAAQTIAEVDECPPRVGLLVTSILSLEESGLTGGEHVLEESLQPLDRSQLTHWLERLLPTQGQLPPSFTEGVHRLTEGFPGQVVSVLGALVQRGSLRVEDGVLAVDPEALSGPLPESIRDALRIREEALSPPLKSLLDVVRVIGAPAEATFIHAILEAESVSLTEMRLSALVDRQLIGAEQDADSDLPLYRAERGGVQLDDSKRRALHQRVCDVLMATDRTAQWTTFGLDIAAYHAIEAIADDSTKEQRNRVQRVCVTAATQAEYQHDPGTQRRCLQWAVQMARNTDAEWTLTHQLCELLRTLGQFDDALDALERVSNPEKRSCEENHQMQIVRAWLRFDRGDYPSAVATLLGTRTEPMTAKAQLLVARCQLMMGQYDDALEHVSLALEHGVKGTVLTDASDVQALVYYYTDRLDLARPSFEAARKTAARLGDGPGEARALTGLGLVHQRLGQYKKAEKAYRDSLKVAVRVGDRKRMAVTEMNIGTVLQITGQSEEAVEHYRASQRASRLLGDDAGMVKAASNLANVLVNLHQLPEAAYWVDRVETGATRNQMSLVLAYNRIVRGMIRHGEGRLDEARAELVEAMNELRALGASGEVGEALIDLGMVARTDQDPDGMRHYAKAIETQVEESAAEKQQVWACFLRGEAERIAGNGETAITQLREALTEADSRGMDALNWRCDGALARAYRMERNPEEAQQFYAKALARIEEQAAGMSSRVRDQFWSEPERAALKREAASVPMEDDELTIEAKEIHERFMRMMEINRRLVTERNPKKLLEFILDSAISLTGAERGFIILVPPSKKPADLSDTDLEVRVARNIDQETLRSSKSRLSHSIARDALLAGKPITTMDASEDDRFKEALSVHSLRLRSILCFPLQLHGQPVGVLYLDNRFQASTFSDVDHDMIRAFSDQAAVSIANTNLHDEAEQAHKALAESHDHIEELNRALEKQVSDQAVQLAEAEQSLKLQRSQLETKYGYENIIGVSPALQKIFNVLDRVTDTDVPVLVEGESGTGKELVAKAIHFNSRQRKQRQFVSVNCAALTETLLESELFGHTKGAFTGADRDRKGLFDMADGGTLFLDEVADMALGMQAKLLRVLQEGEFTPVGSTRVSRVDVRIVAACNQDLAQMVQEKRFRQDLYFRLNVVRVTLPPLRDRSEDFVLLVQHFLNQAAEQFGGPPKQLSASALKLMRNYDWPGNVRELEACMTNACLFCDGDTITPEHLSHKPELSDGSGTRTRAADGEDGLHLGDMTLAELEEKAILAALQRVNGNKAEAAKHLGITRQTLYNKLKAYGIEVQLNIRRR